MTSTPATEANWARVQRLGKYAGPRYQIDGPPRRQWGLNPKQVAEFLKDPRVAEARSTGEASMYRRYAAGNESTAELADDLANGNEHALIVFIHGIEMNILRDAAGFNLIGPVVNPVLVDVDEQYLTAKAAEGVAAAAEINRVADSPGGGMSVHNTPEQLF